MERASQETRGGGTALTPPPAICRQLGAASTQPHMPGGRGPNRVLNAVSPALASSAAPATPVRESPEAPTTELLRRISAERVDRGRRKLLWRAPHFDLDLMNRDTMKGDTKMEGYTWAGTVMDTNGGIGMCVIKGLSAAAILGSAERLTVDIGRAEPKQPTGMPLKLVQRRWPMRAEADAATRPPLTTYGALKARTARIHLGRPRNTSWSSARTAGPQCRTRIASDGRRLRILSGRRAAGLWLRRLHPISLRNLAADAAAPDRSQME